MRALIFSLILMSSMSLRAEECRQIKDRMNLFCDALQDQCVYIKNCLHRRDTCVEKVPTSADECHRLNNCMAKIASKLPEREKCEYKWATGSSKPLCLVEGHFLFFEEGCPGNINGLLSAFAYGLQASVDGKFDCSSSKKLYQKKLESCQEYRQKFESQCMVRDSAEDVALLSDTAPKKCHEYDNFARIPAGAFYMDAEGVEEYSSNRGFNGNQNVVPTGRGYRGSATSASQQ